jgi:Ca-activated chloride channel family protein
VFSSVKKGIEQFRAHNYEQAEKHFIDAQLEDPDNAKLYYDIGTAAYMNGEYKRAMENFSQAARSKDRKLSHDARFNLANTQYRLGNFDEAIRGYESVLKDFPDDNQARENLEFVKQRKKQNAKKPAVNSDHRKNRADNKPDRKLKKHGGDSARPEHKNNTGQKQKPENRKSGGQTRQDRASIPANRKKMRAYGSMQARQSKLNRLEDRPGRAMMSHMPKQFVEKDW